MPRLFDAHNHLQDPRLAPFLQQIMDQCREIGLVKCVVNGTRPDDWENVRLLASEYPEAIPSYGLHPWYVNKESEWKEDVRAYLQFAPAAIGEVGLDRWIKDFDFEAQQSSFAFFLKLAAELDRAVSIHCLKAWGPMLEALSAHPPPHGFLLHSYGGPVEMVPSFVKLGGYFSLSGYFAHDRKARQRETFKSVPLDRLLLETDAPDMLPPPELQEFKLPDAELNHPANIRAVYAFASSFLGIPPADLEGQVEQNFTRLFG